jgi:hypothetical protein
MSPWGKKALAKYSEKAAYTYQSYHSTRLPTEPLKMDLMRCDVVRGAAEAVRVLELSIIFPRRLVVVVDTLLYGCACTAST